MCEIVVMIGMLVMGIIALVTGKIKLTNTKVVQGGWARLIGIILLLPLPLWFGIAVAVGVLVAAQHPDNPQAHIPVWLGFHGFILTAICTIIAVIVGFATASPVEKRRKALMVEDDAEERWEDRRGGTHGEPDRGPPDDRFRQ